MEPEKPRIRIKSPSNPKVKFVRSLYKRADREKSGLIVIEGLREISMALLSGIEIKELFFQPENLEDESVKELTEKISARGAGLTPVSKKVMERMAYRKTSGILVAIAVRPELSIENLPEPAAPLYLVADSIEKPGNIGAIVRTADACGASGVIVTPESCDPLSPNAVRASLGGVFTVPMAVASVEEAITFLKRAKVAIVAATPNADEIYTEVDMHLPTAIVVGSEDKGLRAQWLSAADRLVKIPMKGQIDSLNVSVSAAIVMYEALRQREFVRRGKG